MRWILLALLFIPFPETDRDVLAVEPEGPSKKTTVDFRGDVYPILKSRCFSCHSGRDAEAGYRLDDKRELLGQTSGKPAVIPGKSAKSRLIELVTTRDSRKRMPPDGKGKSLSPREIKVLRAWIDEGLAWDDSILPPVLAKTDHWAFQSIRKPPTPRVKNRAWSGNPIDAFIAVQHARRGLTAAKAASRRVLIRRLSLDLIGLPPTPTEIVAFTRDTSADAYRKLVERLLENPQYGVRWGRHWLDVARWSETEEYESNHPRPFAWRYRDFVVDSFNRDKPFDRFLRQQIAGDEMTPYADENLIGTGFLAAARLSSNEEDKWLQRNTVNVDIVNTLGNAVLGLTINCAQCHNHKFDAISIRDYYRLQGFFINGMQLNLALRDKTLRRNYESQRPAEYEAALDLKSAIFEKARARFIANQRANMSAGTLAAVDKPANERTVAEEKLVRKADLKFQLTPKGVEKEIPTADRKLYDELKKKIEAIEKTVVIPQTFAFYSPVTSPHKTKPLSMLGFYPPPYDPTALEQTRPYLMIRGNVHAIGPKVGVGSPAIFETIFESSRHDSKSPSRSDLVDWLVDPRHPLTARVWVNRIWQYHFGKGIVATAGDFGVRGAKPTHPQLLDWQASELISHGWSTKHIHRLIVTSHTYRQASTVDSRNAKVDPDNDFLTHWSPRRLEAETIRDCMLAASGELNNALGGPSVPVKDSAKAVRRAAYLFQKRGKPPELQGLFDGPSETAESCARRHVSTSPLQSLYLLNGEFVLARSRALARRVIRDVGHDRTRQVERAFLLVLGRRPEAEDRNAVDAFFVRYKIASSGKSNTEDAFTNFCQAMLNLNESLYLE